MCTVLNSKIKELIGAELEIQFYFNGIVGLQKLLCLFQIAGF
ncbi:hypothetical protein [Klebsiella oxytoca]|nr:hypothetical protein [Klebsiella oxytoca]